MGKKLKSIFTEDMDHCMFTGSPYIERHHVFGGPLHSKSEKFHFIAPLRYDLHPNGVGFEPTEENKKIDRYLKAECQKYFEEHYGTREEFMSQDMFGKNYL